MNKAEQKLRDRNPTLSQRQQKEQESHAVARSLPKHPVQVHEVENLMQHFVDLFLALSNIDWGLLGVF